MGQIFVRDIDGETVPHVCGPSSTVGELKHEMKVEGRLLFGGEQMEDDMLLQQCGVTDESTVYVNNTLDGGAKKRKKKTYTKPEKIKHKRKKVKLAVLKFYKVDSNDKVTRLRRECPHELCGPGVFMAMHFNRYYCGKCHLTYLTKKGDGDA